MAQISISDTLYHRLQETALQQGVSIEAFIQETLEGAGNTPTPLPLQEEQHLFEMLDQIAQQNGAIPSEEWGKLVSEMRD